MDFHTIYSFLFESFAGIAVLVGACLVITLLLAVILERRTKRIYKHREANPDDWSLFGDDDSAEESDGTADQEAAK